MDDESPHRNTMDVQMMNQNEDLVMMGDGNNG